MSTQEAKNIEFSIAPEEDQERFRLLELPPELLDLLASSDTSVLKIKSSEVSHGKSTNSNIVLCTPDKTFELRQVSTSNSVYITRPSGTRSAENDIARPGIRAVAKCDTTLEVLSSRDASAGPNILSTLPIYTSTGHFSTIEPVSKERLFADIPLSGSQCAKAWRDLACFELPESQSSFVPSASAKLKAWKAILEQALAVGIDSTHALDKAFISNVLDSENDWPVELSLALLESMTMNASDDGEIVLDGRRCAQVVGETLLEESTSGPRGSMSTSAFKGEWADLLPEPWRGHADLSNLGGCYSLYNGGAVVAYVESRGKQVSATSGNDAAEAKAVVGTKRKWHDKFRVSKKA